MSKEQQQKPRVCVIGGGPSGMSILSAFMYAKEKGADVPELVCFEKQEEMGGLWNYSWRVGVDEYGESVHGSMYRYLWSNGPKECLEMADYTYDEHFKKPIPSFPPRLVLRDYLLGKAKKYGIEKFIRTRHVVRAVEEVKDSNGKKFTVKYENLRTRKCATETFDYVVVATGHFSVPNFPTYPGVETFPGDVLHSHDFKDAVKYKDKRIVIVGASYSGEDIALQLYKYGAKEVIISYRTAPMGYKFPDCIQEWPLLRKVDRSTVHFSNGKTFEADAMIFCTGYQHHFPFMPDNIRLHSSNVLYPDNLYKGCIFNESTNICYLGMQDQWYTFTLFDSEAWFVRDYILGRIKLPAKEERDADIKKWLDRSVSIHKDISNCVEGSWFEALYFQRDFIADLYTVGSIHYVSCRLYSVKKSLS